MIIVEEALTSEKATSNMEAAAEDHNLVPEVINPLIMKNIKIDRDLEKAPAEEEISVETTEAVITTTIIIGEEAAEEAVHQMEAKTEAEATLEENIITTETEEAEDTAATEKTTEEEQEAETEDLTCQISKNL